MKKVLAMSGAAALGATGLGVAATPAEAAPALPACEDLSQHFNVGKTADSDWYMDCVPQ